MTCTECWIGALIVCIATLIYVSHTFRYYFKFWAYSIGNILISVLPLPMFILRPRDYRNAYIITSLNRWMIYILGVSFEVRGTEHIRKDHGGVVLLNHQSLIDMSAVSHLWPLIGRATTIAKKELLYVFPFGPAAYLWGTLFIDRKDHKKALNKLNHEVVEIKDHQVKILIFPEGTRSQRDQLLPFKKGAFHMAVQSQSSIQPVVVSKYWFIDSDRKWFGRGRCIIQVLPEISCVGLTAEDVPNLIEKTHQLMQTEFERLSAETKKFYTLNFDLFHLKERSY